MIKKVLLVSLLTVFSFANPYENLSAQEKLNVFTNYFLNESLKGKLPEKPLKGIPKNNEYNYEPTKYELYYNYVQRIKAIEESIAEEQKKLDEKYEADIYKYNQKLKALKKFYLDQKNLSPIVQKSFNKAIKVVYGKPILITQSGSKGVGFFLDAQTIYGKKSFSPKSLEFNFADEKMMFNFYEKCDVRVTFSFKDNMVEYDEVSCSYQNKIYQGKFNENNNEKIKLDVKINDDIFQQIKISNKDNK